MISRNVINITVSLVALLLIILIALRYCGKDKYSKQDIESAQAATKAAYEDTLQFVRGQMELQANKAEAQTVVVLDLEKQIDSLISKHQVTKTKLRKPSEADLLSDTSFVLAPNEYVRECEECFHMLSTYKKENIQLRFERDGYDSLMRGQSDIHEKRINELEGEKLIFNKMFNDCESKRASATSGNTRKLKMSGAGMFNNIFMPRAGGFGLIYEDRKFNEYGGHILFSNAGEIYMFHIAKTISFRRKK